MKYMGSKSRIASSIVPIIQSYVNDNPRKVYVEPFVGGCNVIDKIVCDMRFGFDINDNLISLLRHVQDGGELPETVTRTDYEAAQKLRGGGFDSWYIGCVGFLASYNGKFFGGYSGRVQTKEGTIRDYYDEAKRNLLRQSSAISDIAFMTADYRYSASSFRGCVIYCDPPYMQTTGYQQRFDHEEFWREMKRLSKQNVVLISEQEAPKGFTCVWEGTVTRTNDNASRFQSTERLFIA